MSETEHSKTLFIIGCPRSGTTWVQLLLSQFREVATAPETQIFAYYLTHFRNQWRVEHEGPGRRHQGRTGLSRLLSEEEFEELCRRSAQLVLDKIAAQNPGARVVCEKSPKHALLADFIHRIFPDAYFLHVIRDPRDTAASLLAAGRSWGGGWAPRNAIDAARMWNEHITRARVLAGRTERYLELQYEALRARPATRLHEVMRWLGVEQTPDACERAVAACELGKLQSSADGDALPIPGSRSPQGFFRNGSVGGGQNELPRTDLRIVEALCSELMDELGYTRVTGGSRPLRVPVHDAIQRVRESIDWQLQRLLHHV